MPRAHVKSITRSRNKLDVIRVRLTSPAIRTQSVARYFLSWSLEYRFAIRNDISYFVRVSLLLFHGFAFLIFIHLCARREFYYTKLYLEWMLSLSILQLQYARIFPDSLFDRFVPSLFSPLPPKRFDGDFN